jgi:hypothetical protein
MKYLVEHKNQFDNLIYLTDGECSSPNTKPLKPILWVHSSKSKINEEVAFSYDFSASIFNPFLVNYFKENYEIELPEIDFSIDLQVLYLIENIDT